MMEALIGAVTVDSNWNWQVLEDVVDRLVNIQFSSPDHLLRSTYYEQLNSPFIFIAVIMYSLA